MKRFFSPKAKKGLTDMLCNHIMYDMIAKAKKEETAFFQVRDFPVELRRSFKAACSIEGVSMREKVIELVRGYVEKKEKKGKK